MKGKPKGSPKTGGRVRGTLNVKVQEVLDAVKASGSYQYLIEQGGS